MLEVVLPSGQPVMMNESAVEIVDRGFMLADLVRATGASKGQAGTIVKLETEVQLQRVLSMEVIEGWHKAEEVVASTRLSVRYRVHTG